MLETGRQAKGKGKGQLLHGYYLQPCRTFLRIPFIFNVSSLRSSRRIPRRLLIPVIGPGYYFHRRASWRPHYFTEESVCSCSAVQFLSTREKNVVLPAAQYLTVMEIGAVTAGLAFISNGGGRLSQSFQLFCSSFFSIHRHTHFLVFTLYSLSEPGLGSGGVAARASVVSENCSCETSACWPWRIGESSVLKLTALFCFYASECWVAFLFSCK